MSVCGVTCDEAIRSSKRFRKGSFDIHFLSSIGLNSIYSEGEARFKELKLAVMPESAIKNPIVQRAIYALPSAVSIGDKTANIVDKSEAKSTRNQPNWVDQY